MPLVYWYALHADLPNEALQGCAVSTWAFLSFPGLSFQLLKKPGRDDVNFMHGHGSPFITAQSSAIYVLAGAALSTLLLTGQEKHLC